VSSSARDSIENEEPFPFPAACNRGDNASSEKSDARNQLFAPRRRRRRFIPAMFFFYHYFDVESQQISLVLKNMARQEKKRYSVSRGREFDSASVAFIAPHWRSIVGDAIRAMREEGKNAG
jgi:hypothetical protein